MRVCICATGTLKADGLADRWFSITMRMLMRGLLPALAVPINVPASAHEHVRGKDAAAGKMHQQPLAARFHLFDLLAGRAACLHGSG